MEKRESLFNKWYCENWTATCKIMKLELSLMPYRKIISKWFKDLNIRPTSITLTEKNIGETFFDIGGRTIFLGQSPMAKDIKAKINRWDFIKLKCFCIEKETVSKTKRQSMD